MGKEMSKHSILLSAALCLVTVGTANATLLTNGDFETGDFTGWNTSQLGGSSLFVAANPGDPQLGPSPTNDHYAFAGNQGGPSQNIFWQAFALPNGITGLDFSFDYAFVNFVGFINPTPDTLTYDSEIIDNQQFRVEILTGSALFDSVDPEDIVFTAIQTLPDTLNPQAWTSFSQDIFSAVSPYQGQTLQVRFAQVDNQAPFDIGFDNVSLIARSSDVPEPGSLTLLGLVLLGVRLSRLSKFT